jgi:hypothetical protein
MNENTGGKKRKKSAKEERERLIWKVEERLHAA